MNYTSNFFPLTGPPASYPAPQYGYPSVPADIVHHMMAYVEVSEQKKAELWYRLQQQAHQDQLRQEILELNGKTCTLSKRGSPQVLANCTFPLALWVEPQPPLREEPFFLIWSSLSDTPLRITENDFFHDSRLITGLHSHSGLEVTLIGSQKKTASLLRLAITGHLTIVHQEAYAGWQKCGENYRFQLFSNHSAHWKNESMLPRVSTADKPPDFSAVAATSAQQIWPVFRLVSDRTARQMVVLWFYAAQLYSLLREIGHEIPMALYLFSSDHDLPTYLKHLFCWYGDAPISPDTATAEFKNALLCRRDQPLLLMDNGGSKRAMENISAFERTLADLHVEWRSGKKSTSLPLQALPTIISNQISSLCCIPQVVVVEVAADNFDWSGWVELFNEIGDHAEHRECFARFTEMHIDDLRVGLEDGKKRAIKMSRRQLNERCVQTLGVLLGMQTFLQRFFRFCAPAIPPIRVDDEEMTNQLFNWMKEATEKEFMASFPEQFAYVAQQHIQTGSLKLFSRVKMTDAANAVYADDKLLHFTAPAFCSVCKALHQSRPVVLHALAAEGLLRGAQTNPGTAQTRIRVYHADGRPEQVAVYSFERDRFEDLGDPLPLEGGGWV